jgi:hypothetical protein
MTTDPSADEREATLLITFRFDLKVGPIRSDPRYAELAERVRVSGTAPMRDA